MQNQYILDVQINLWIIADSYELSVINFYWRNTGLTAWIWLYFFHAIENELHYSWKLFEKSFIHLTIHKKVYNDYLPIVSPSRHSEIMPLCTVHSLTKYKWLQRIYYILFVMAILWLSLNCVQFSLQSKPYEHVFTHTLKSIFTTFVLDFDLQIQIVPIKIKMILKVVVLKITKSSSVKCINCLLVWPQLCAGVRLLCQHYWPVKFRFDWFKFFWDTLYLWLMWQRW